MKNVKQQGFTLIELMITIGIAVIVMGIAVPSFTTLIENNLIQAKADSVYSAIMLARSESIARNQPVIICKSSDGSSCTSSGNWEQGWFIYADTNANNVKDSSDPILQVYEAFPTNFLLRPDTAYANQLVYQANGSVTSQGTFEFFPPCTSSENATVRQVIISSTGRPRRNETTATCP